MKARTLGDVIDRVLAFERRLDDPAPDPSHELLRALLAAVENHERARHKFVTFRTQADLDHLNGARHNLETAKRAAQNYLTPML